MVDGSVQAEASAERTEANTSVTDRRHRLLDARDLLYLLERYGLLLLTAAVIVFFALLPATSATYLTTANIQSTIANQAVLGVAAIAVLFPLLTGRYDLSIGAILGLSAVGTAAAMSNLGWALVPAIALALAIGIAIGVFNGLIVTRFRINSIIGTIAVATVIGGIILWYTDGRSIVTDISPVLTDFGIGNTFGIPRAVFVLVGVAVAAWYVIEHTPVGRYLHAIGSNEEAAQLVGLRVERLITISFVLAGLVAAVAGALLVARSGGASPTAGPLFTLPAFAAVFLGAAAIRPGRYNVGGTLVAILFLAAITSGLNLAGAQDYVNDLVNGIALLIGVGISAHLGRRRAGE